MRTRSQKADLWHSLHYYVGGRVKHIAWDRFPGAIQLIERARGPGIAVFFDGQFQRATRRNGCKACVQRRLILLGGNDQAGANVELGRADQMVKVDQLFIGDLGPAA